MKKRLITSTLFLLFAALLPAQQTFYSVLSGFAGMPTCIRETPTGKFIVNSHGNEYYLLNSTGGVTWAKQLIAPGLNYDGQYSIPTIDGGYVVSGHATSSSTMTSFGFIAKMDPAGQVQWMSKTAASNDLTGYTFSGIEQTADSGYIVAGGKSEVAVTGNRRGALLMKVDAAGNTTWSKAVVPDTTQFSYSQFTSVKIASNGDYIAAGITDFSVLLCRFDPNGNLLWNKTFLPGLLMGLTVYLDIAGDGGCIIGCSLDDDNNNQDQACLLKTDAAGNFQWCKKYGNDNQMGLKSVRATYDGGFAFIGMEETVQPWGAAIAKTDASGTLQWVTKFDSVRIWQTQKWSKFEFEHTADHGYIFGGMVLNSPQNSLRIVKTDPNGEVPCVGHPITLSVASVFTSANNNAYSIPGESLSVVTFIEQAGVLNRSLICSGTFGENPKGVEETAGAQSFLLYPNPASEFLQVETDFPGMLEIYNATGQLVKTELVGAGPRQLDIRMLPVGLYFAVIDTGKMRLSQKFIRE